MLKQGVYVVVQNFFWFKFFLSQFIFLNQLVFFKPVYFSHISVSEQRLLAWSSGDETGLQIQTNPKVSSSNRGEFQKKKKENKKIVLSYKMVKTKGEKREKKGKKIEEKINVEKKR